MRSGKIIAFKDTQATVLEQGTKRSWKIPCVSMQGYTDAERATEQAAYEPPPEPVAAKTPAREFQRGDTVTFDDRDGRGITGVIVRVNQRTATIGTATGGTWRVPFHMLRHGVVVLFVQIGALCSENPLHDKHLRFQHLRTLRTFRADWCASSLAAPCGPRPAVSRDLPGQTSSLRSRNSSLNCQPSKAATMRPSSSQEISRPSMTTIGTRWSSSGSLSTVPRKIRRSFTCGP